MEYELIDSLYYTQRVKHKRVQVNKVDTVLVRLNMKPSSYNLYRITILKGRLLAQYR